VSLFYTYNFFSLTSSALSYTEIFEEIPVKIHNSSLITALMFELECMGVVPKPEHARLELTKTMTLEKNVDLLIDESEELITEQHKLQFHYRAVQRQHQQQAKWVQQRVRLLFKDNESGGDGKEGWSNFETFIVSFFFDLCCYIFVFKTFFFFIRNKKTWFENERMKMSCLNMVTKMIPFGSLYLHHLNSKVFFLPIKFGSTVIRQITSQVLHSTNKFFSTDFIRSNYFIQYII
jgi:hypothetical protein